MMGCGDVGTGCEVVELLCGVQPELCQVVVFGDFASKIAHQGCSRPLGMGCTFPFELFGILCNTKFCCRLLVVEKLLGRSRALLGSCSFHPLECAKDGFKHFIHTLIGVRDCFAYTFHV